jgi:hypothetical protein
MRALRAAFESVRSLLRGRSRLQPRRQFPQCIQLLKPLD